MCTASVMGHAETVDDTLRAALVALLEKGRKLEAIRLHRARTGSSLAEAKTAVESLGVEVKLPAADVIWMTFARRGFFAIPANVELPPGEACMIDPRGRLRYVDATALAPHGIPAAVARAVLGERATRPGCSAVALEHRARLTPDDRTVWIDRLIRAARPHLNDWQRSTMQEYLDVNEDVLAAEMLGDWLIDAGPLPPALRALLSDTLVACGLEPLPPPPPPPAPENAT
jgi:hypothetical protein